MGTSDSALRLVSAVAGTLSVPVVWLLAYRLTGSGRSAVLAAALLAFNPLHIWYSQGARPYALPVSLGSAAFLALTYAIEGDHKGWWIAFIVLSAASGQPSVAARPVRSVGPTKPNHQ